MNSRMYCKEYADRAGGKLELAELPPHIDPVTSIQSFRYSGTLTERGENNRVFTHYVEGDLKKRKKDAAEDAAKKLKQSIEKKQYEESRGSNPQNVYYSSTPQTVTVEEVPLSYGMNGYQSMPPQTIAYPMNASSGSDYYRPPPHNVPGSSYASAQPQAHSAYQMPMNQRMPMNQGQGPGPSHQQMHMLINQGQGPGPPHPQMHMPNQRMPMNQGPRPPYQQMHMPMNQGMPMPQGQGARPMPTQYMQTPAYMHRPLNPDQSQAQILQILRSLGRINSNQLELILANMNEEGLENFKKLLRAYDMEQIKTQFGEENLEKIRALIDIKESSSIQHGSEKGSEHVDIPITSPDKSSPSDNGALSSMKPEEVTAEKNETTPGDREEEWAFIEEQQAKEQGGASSSKEQEQANEPRMQKSNEERVLPSSKEKEEPNGSRKRKGLGASQVPFDYDISSGDDGDIGEYRELGGRSFQRSYVRKDLKIFNERFPLCYKGGVMIMDLDCDNCDKAIKVLCDHMRRNPQSHGISRLITYINPFRKMLGVPKCAEVKEFQYDDDREQNNEVAGILQISFDLGDFLHGFVSRCPDQASSVILYSEHEMVHYLGNMIKSKKSSTSNSILTQVCGDIPSLIRTLKVNYIYDIPVSLRK